MLAGRLEEGRRAAALAAEVEIGADNDAGDTKRIDEEARTKSSASICEKSRLKRHHDDAVEAEGLGQPRLGVGRWSAGT